MLLHIEEPDRKMIMDGGIMKIDIITFHFVSNCGGVLQCYATQKFLEKCGHEVNVIDYRPEYHTIRYQAIKNPFVYVKYYKRQFQNKGLIKKTLLMARAFVRCVVLDLNASERKVAHLFESFIEKNLKLTRKYTTIKQLNDDPPIADAYVTGSDQLWNPDLLEDQYDPAYFLDFGNESIPRVAYAVSTGKELNVSEAAELSHMCKNLTAISIREFSQNVIDSMKSGVHICIDPTLLLEADDYVQIQADIKEQKPYIFVYGFEDNETLHDVVNMIQNKYEIRIINGCPHRIHLDNNVKDVRECGPAEFLALIKNATFVVTNSFHGTALSIIYKKEFVTLAHSTRGKRMTELLNKLDLSSRLWGSEDFSIDTTINWKHVEERLDPIRQHSSQFLLSAISGKKGDEIPHVEESVRK